MSSIYVENLYKVADQLEQDGQYSSATTCREAGMRMERMETFIVEATIEKLGEKKG